MAVGFEAEALLQSRKCRECREWRSRTHRHIGRLPSGDLVEKEGAEQVAAVRLAHRDPVLAHLTIAVVSQLVSEAPNVQGASLHLKRRISQHEGVPRALLPLIRQGQRQ